MSGRQDPELAAAMARALAYTDDVGLSDGTDRPASDADAVIGDAIDRELDPERLGRFVDNAIDAGLSLDETIRLHTETEPVSDSADDRWSRFLSRGDR